jgi:hypothetical protein
MARENRIALFCSESMAGFESAVKSFKWAQMVADSPAALS